VTGLRRPADVGVLDLVLCWTGGLVGYLVGEYGTGALVAATIGDGGAAAVPSWVWLPWVAGPLLCGVVAAVVLVLLRARPAWWHWPLVGGLVPLAAAPVTWFVTLGAAGGELAVGVLVQVLLAACAGAASGALARAGGRLLPARRQPDAPPTYSS